MPAVFAVGYSNDLLSNDPNLAEGLPAVDTPMVVRGGEARVASDAPLELGKPAFVDPTVKLEGDTATVARTRRWRACRTSSPSARGGAATACR